MAKDRSLDWIRLQDSGSVNNTWMHIVYKKHLLTVLNRIYFSLWGQPNNINQQIKEIKPLQLPYMTSVPSFQYHFHGSLLVLNLLSMQTNTKPEININ